MIQGGAVSVISSLSVAMKCVPDADYFLLDQATSASATTLVTSFLNNPNKDSPNVFLVRIDPGGTTADVPAGDVVVTGWAWDDTARNFIEKSVNVTFLANATDPIDTAVPFKRITSILFPIQDGASATYTVGISPLVDFRFGINGTTALALSSIRVVYSDAAAAAEPVTFVLDSGQDSTFDMLLASIDMQAESATVFVHDFQVPQILFPGDILDIAALNGNARNIAVQLIGFFT